MAPGDGGHGPRRPSPLSIPAHLDNLTHALVGAALSKADAERTTPLATATLVVAANAPDVDMLAFLEGPYFALAFRRGVTHGLPAMLVLPWVVTAGALVWDRLVRRRRHPEAAPARAGPLLALSYLGILTHPALDWMNTYGMRWWLPFSGAWSYGDALFIIDPWIWLTLGGAVFLASRSGGVAVWAWAFLAVLTTALVAYGGGAGALAVWGVGLASIVAIRARRGGARPIPARRVGGALAGVTLYILLLVVGDAVASAQVHAAATRAGLAVEDVMVAPMPANPLRSDVEVLTPDAYVPGSHRWLGGAQVQLDHAAAVPRLSAPADLPPGVVEAIVAAARARPDVRDYLVWSRYPLVRITATDDAWTVRYGDARYDDRPEAGSLAGVTVQIPRSEIR